METKCKDCEKVLPEEHWLTKESQLCIDCAKKRMAGTTMDDIIDCLTSSNYLVKYLLRSVDLFCYEDNF